MVRVCFRAPLFLAVGVGDARTRHDSKLRTSPLGTDEGRGKPSPHTRAQGCRGLCFASQYDCGGRRSDELAIGWRVGQSGQIQNNSGFTALINPVRSCAQWIRIMSYAQDPADLYSVAALVHERGALATLGAASNLLRPV